MDRETLYLWDIHLPAWEIFILLRNFLDENGVIPTDLLIRIVDEMNKKRSGKKKLDLLTLLEEIPYIHGSYLDERHNLTKEK